MSLIARLSTKFVLDPSTGCWVWTASTRGPTPVHQYGQIRVGSQVLEAHRVVYALVVGDVPEGLTLDHLCRNPRCVNPGHLEPVPHRVNVLRGQAPAAKNARKTHCVHGHELAGDNVRWDGRRRRCVACRGASPARS